MTGDMAQRIANWAKAEYGEELFGIGIEHALREVIHNGQLMKSAEKRGYPEHAKLHAAKDRRAMAQVFYDWLHEERELCICEYVKGRAAGNEWVPSGYYPISTNPTNLLGEFLDVDPNKLEEEKRRMLKELQDG